MARLNPLFSFFFDCEGMKKPNTFFPGLSTGQDACNILRLGLGRAGSDQEVSKLSRDESGSD